MSAISYRRGGGRGAAPKTSKPANPWTDSLVLAFLCLLVLSIACGKKTPIRPPELIAPEPVSELRLEIEKTGVHLRWERPQRYVDGREMDDLGGFVVLRATRNGQGTSEVFTPLATVVVEDRDRFRKAKRFDYSDQQLATGTLYRYRVQAFTLDGYYSPPSNTVEVVWKGGP